MWKKTSPQMSVRSASRQNETWPGLWPGVSSTTKPCPSSSPSRSSRSGSTFGDPATGPNSDGDAVPGRDRGLAAAQVRRVGRADPDGHAERLVHVLGPAGVVVVHVRQRVHADVVVADGLDHGPPREDVAGVDEDVAHEVGVHPVARDQRDLPDVVGDLVHGPDTSLPRMSENPVLTERRDNVLLITLNRPDQRNAVNGAVADGVAAALDELDARRRPDDRRPHRRRQGLLLRDGPRAPSPPASARGTPSAGSRASCSARRASRSSPRSRGSRWPAGSRSRSPAT